MTEENPPPGALTSAARESHAPTGDAGSRPTEMSPPNPPNPSPIQRSNSGRHDEEALAAASGEREYSFAKEHAEDLRRNWIFHGRLLRGLRAGIFILGFLASALPGAVAVSDRDPPEEDLVASTADTSSSEPHRPNRGRSPLGNSIIFFASLAATIYTAARARLMFPVGDLYRDAAEDLGQAIHASGLKYMRYTHAYDLDGVRATVNDLEKRRESLRKGLRRDIAKITGKKGEENDNV